MIVIYESDDELEMSSIKEVQIKGKLTKDIQLFPNDIKSTSTITFKDWNNLAIETFMSLEFDQPSKITRIIIDFYVGNKNYIVDETEVEIFEEFFRFMIEVEEEDEDESTENEFYVNDIFYNPKKKNIFEGSELFNVTGNIMDLNPVMVKVYRNLSSDKIIPVNLNHTIKINVTYERGEEGFGVKNIILHDGFILENYIATENVLITGIGTSEIIIEFIGEYEKDGWEFVKIYAIKYPDLNITNLSFSNPNPMEGDSIKINVDMQNIGNDIAKDISIELYVDHVLEDTKNIASMNVGQSITIPFDWTATSGTHLIKIWIKAENERSKDQANNNFTTNINVDKKFTDLEIIEITYVPPDPMDGNILDIIVEIKNNGTGTVENVKISLYIDGIIIETKSIETIGPHESNNTSFSWNAIEGTHEIKSIVYSENEDFQYKGNNNFTTQIIVRKKSCDLEINAINISNPEPKEGETITITVTVKNIGNIASESIELILYIDGFKLKNMTYGPIEAGKSNNFSIEWKATKGANNITVRVKTENEEVSLEKNNEGKETVMVKPKDKDKFPIIFIILPILIIVGIIISVFVMKDKKQETVTTIQNSAVENPEEKITQPIIQETQQEIQTQQVQVLEQTTISSQDSHQKKNCPFCNQQIPIDYKFCNYCGKQIYNET